MATLQAAPAPVSSGEVTPLTSEESAIIFERAARRYLKMSTDEVLSRMESGFFKQHPELNQRLDSVLFYLPLVKR